MKYSNHSSFCLVRIRNLVGAMTLSLWILLGGIISDASAQTMINYGDLLQGSLVTPSEIDSFTFSGSTNDVITIRMASSWQGGPQVELYDSAGALLIRVSGGVSITRIDTFHLPSSGSYSILVMDDDGGSTGNYVLCLQRTFSPGQATSISYGDMLSGTVIMAAQMNAYTFSGSTNDVITIRMFSEWTGGPQVELYDTTGALLKRASGGGGVTRIDTFQLLTSGSYTILVMDDDGGSTGNYVLCLQRTFSPGQATSISYGETLPDTLWAGGGQMNAYTFSGSADDVIFIRMYSSWTGGPQVELYDTTGALLKRASGGGGVASIDAIHLPTSGSYTILAMDITGVGTGFYTLSLELDTTAAGLVAYYPFNGNANDESGNGNNGTVYGATLTYDRFGQSSKAYYFNGAGDWIEAPGDQMPATSRTVSVWYDFDGDAYHPVLFGYGGGPFCGSSFFLGAWTGNPTYYFVSQHCTTPYLAAYSPLNMVGGWHHVVVTSDAEGSKFYLDGVLISTDSTLSFWTATPGTDLALGVDVSWQGQAPYVDSNVGWMKGILDDIRIYNYALTDSAIQELYHEDGYAGTQYAFQNSWNLISLPLKVGDAKKASLFPMSTSNAFAFGPLGYVTRDTLQNGSGYWLKFPSAQNVIISGIVRPNDTVHVVSGWNIVGTISSPVDTSAVQQLPPGILLSPFFEYTGSYVVADTLWPAKGYWIKAGGSGSIILSAPAAPQRVSILPKPK